MPESLIEEFHPSIRSAVACWFDSASSSPEVQAHHADTMRRFPALAVMAAFGISRWLAASRGLCELPKEKFGLRLRLGRGVRPNTPADRLRVKMGRKYITVFAASEVTEEKLAT